MFLHVEFLKKKSYNKSNYKQVDKSNIFVSVSTLKIQNYEMIISRIQTTVSYICNFYAWKWWYRQERVNEWLNVCVYFHQNVTILCSNNHTNHVILTFCVYKRSLRWLFCITYIYIYLFHVFVNKLLSLFQLSFYNSKQPFCWWNDCVNIFITTALRTLCLSAYLCLFVWGRVS